MHVPLGIWTRWAYMLIVPESSTLERTKSSCCSNWWLSQASTFSNYTYTSFSEQIVTADRIFWCWVIQKCDTQSCIWHCKTNPRGADWWSQNLWSGDEWSTTLPLWHGPTLRQQFDLGCRFSCCRRCHSCRESVKKLQQQSNRMKGNDESWDTILHRLLKARSSSTNCRYKNNKSNCKMNTKENRNSRPGQVRALDVKDTWHRMLAHIVFILVSCSKIAQ